MKMNKTIIKIAATLLLTASIGYGSAFQNSKSVKADEQKYIEIVAQVSNTEQFEKSMKSLSGKITGKLPFIDSYVIKVPENQVNDVKNIPSVTKITESHEIKTSNLKIGKENFYNHASGQNNTHKSLVNADSIGGNAGEGVTVAVLDSGIGQTNNNISSINITHSVAINPEATSTDDFLGHGTHVAGIIAGNGLNAGVAPGANIVNVKLGDDNGVLTEVDLLLGLQWVFDYKDQYNIKVVNLSVSSTTPQSYLDSPISAAVEQLWLNGVTVVTAAGNSLDDQSNVNYAPANDPFVITVGALDGAGENSVSNVRLADWSRKGVTSENIVKPEVNAPGVKLLSYLPSINAQLAIEHPEAVYNKNYFEMSGTSMAAPVVSGAAAIMIAANPDITPDQIKYILTASSVKTNGTSIIDVKEAVSLAQNENYLDGIPKDYNVYPLSNYMDQTNNTVDYSKASWRSLDWLKASWRSVDWSKASWRYFWEELGQ